jgi:hypothetical protein
MTHSRRRFLALAPLALVGAHAALADPAPGSSNTCADPAALPLMQRNRRRSLGYAEPSPDPARHCSLCSFFTASGPACGTCAMLSGGPVSAGGLCSSFAAKKA